MKIILILGNKLLSSGKMTKILKERLDSGIKHYKKNDIFLVSGGNIANLSHTEAYVMKKYILSYKSALLTCDIIRKLELGWIGCCGWDCEQW